MTKKKIITIALILLVGGVITGGYVISYINDIKAELVSANKKVTELEDVNNNYTKEIDKLVGELEVSIKESIELKDANENLTKTNEDLKKQVTSLEKEIEELEKKVYPTRTVNDELNSANKGTPVSITMTFYGDIPSGSIDANGNKLILGTVASNYYPQGTQFEYNGQIFTVRDRGGSKLDSPNRLDVYVPRLNNESDSEYRQRLLEYGVKTVVMYKR